MREIEIILLKNFAKAASKLLSVTELDDLVVFLAQNPELGAIIQGSGGLRKVRWAYGGKGKSGGSRVIYYYHKSEFEIYMLTIYSKNSQENLSKSEIKSLMQLVEVLKNEK
jgi:mRNA-degrading endonuclease RelE of RelBE toxin-antitoxin system